MRLAGHGHMFRRMERTHPMHTYTVAGGVTPVLPGAFGPDELDGEADWRSAAASGALLERIALRLGSVAGARKVILAVLGPLRATLAGPPLESILAHLPGSYAREVAEVEWNLDAAVPEAEGTTDYLQTVARLVQLPPRVAAAYVLATLGAIRGALDPLEAEAVARQLPADLARLWRAAT